MAIFMDLSKAFDDINHLHFMFWKKLSSFVGGLKDTVYRVLLLYQWSAGYM